MGVPLVLYRTPDGEATALLDRCPHRNVPLSRGRVVGDLLECPYHGWRFDRSGQCAHVPGLCNDEVKPGRRASSFATREQDGLVWIYATADTEPVRDPFAMPLVNDPRYTTVYEMVEANGSIHATAENALDVPHTAFLHGGLFRKRGGERNRIEVVVRRWHDRVEAEYRGEPRPSGLAGRLLAPKGGTVEHFDRFYLPSIVQVEYRLGAKTHFLVTAALTPIADFKTQLFAVISFRLPIPGWLVKPFLRPVALRIFGQDAQMLAEQTRTIDQFGGEQYMSTEIDVVGPQIQRLLLQAERGERTPIQEPVTRTIHMST